MAEIKNVMISSTSLDLPDHRKAILDACQQQGMHALMMEDLPAHDSTAETASLKMVDKADIYVGVFAHRYGHIPKENNPSKISITEMEYNRAVERKIPRVIFIIHKDHPIKIEDVELGDGAVKLKVFLERVKTGGNIVNFFESPADLRANAINSLSQYRESDTTKFHYNVEIPVPPDKYVAHPYILQQTQNLIGRREELKLLTDWISNPNSEVYKAHIVSIVAIGGMGKSALTWEWFNEVAPEEMNPLAGRMWWSFYESDGSFENFVTRTLAYVSNRSLEEVMQIPGPDRESMLVAILDKEPFVIVLDGLERLLTAYARADAAQLKDSEIEGNTNSRKTADPRVGVFLKKLAGVRNSRILISTRLLPGELETVAGGDLPGCHSRDLEGMTDEDAIELWRAFGVSGSRNILLPIFNSFGKHPLLIQALAGEVSGSYKASGNFEKWRKVNPQFDPVQFTVLQDAMGHVLEAALGGLDKKTYQVLYTLAAFRMPAQYDTLAAILIGDGKLFVNDSELDEALRELNSRGLIGWDKHASRFDLHPIVRGVVWSRLGSDTRHGVYTDLHHHFKVLPVIEDDKVKSLDDLTPSFELYNILIGLRLYEEAWNLFDWRLAEITTNRFCGDRQRIELLEMLFPDGMGNPPRLRNYTEQARAQHELAISYHVTGRLKEAIQFYEHSNKVNMETNNLNLLVGLSNLSSVSRLVGALFNAEFAVRSALIIVRKRSERHQESRRLEFLGLVLGALGLLAESESCLKRALHILVVNRNRRWEVSANSSLSSILLYSDNPATALAYANRAWDLARDLNYDPELIGTALSQGEAALASGPNKFVLADERLHFSLTRARAGNTLDAELQALIALAELRRRQGDEKAAREFLDDVWEYAERGPYPLFHADALNVLAQIERDAGNKEAAIEAATKAYQLAWCDGPPYAYHWGLIEAQKNLEELDAPLPEMPPFDESKYEPMPEVEIDPEDEFHVGESS